MIKVGLERIDEYLHLFEGKRVGIITNPTGVDHEFRSTVDILVKNVHVTALFSPEHGIRGNLQAGVHLDPYVDEKTKTMVYSLYGNTRKPTQEMLDDVDVLVFDIQDVGARFYTFLYTMVYAMQACQEYGKTFVVLDRPNPVGGVKVEGNILDITYRSFVGYYAIPQRFGLTIGELARYFNEIEKIHCDLHVIPLQGWKRSMHYRDTGRHWIAPSPNIPTPETCYPYLATCIFEGTNVSEGRGTTKPFQFIGAPWMKVEDVIREFNQYHLQGISLREQYFTPMFSKHQGQLCHGLEFIVTCDQEADLIYAGMVLFKIIEKIHPEFEILPPFREGSHPFIQLLVGDQFLQHKMIDLDAIKQKLTNDAQTFQTLKEMFHLYDV